MPKETRRKFIRDAGLSAGALALGPLFRANRASANGWMGKVFQVDETRGVLSDGGFGGLDDLFSLMGRHGLHFYQTNSSGPISGPDGIIGRQDVVLLKVNSQWDDRGMTNCDMVRGLVQRIVEHPDGFDGEIVFVDNVQFKAVSDCFGWQTLTNSENRSLNYRDIIEDFSSQGYKISGYDWRTSNWRSGGLDVVTDPDDHFTDTYYHDPDNLSEHYPRFTTEHGTRVNFRHGIWTGSEYDNSRLKLINLPMLKDHQYKTMITACLKNYMGVIAPSYGDPWKIEYHDNFQYKVGKMVGGTRFPDLNILDATWVITKDGPEGYATNAVEVGTLIAGVDPVAVDYHAGKHVLFPLSSNNRHHPDNSNNLHTCLTSALTDLRSAGYEVMPSLEDSSYTLLTNQTLDVGMWRLY
ncbi:MAG: DUF362 domain-containing protein [Candidatus Omnitrophica bacterium]|nr:DUF362 domain-containing protein [Candidatus Omnitrophota bacterium]